MSSGAHVKPEYTMEARPVGEIVAPLSRLCCCIKLADECVEALALVVGCDCRDADGIGYQSR